MGATLGRRAQEQAGAATRPASASQPLSELAFGALDQFGRPHVEGPGKRKEGADRGRVLAALQEADVRGVQVACCRQRFLGQLLGPPRVPKDAPERFVQPLGAALRSLGHGSDCRGLAYMYSTEYVLSFSGNRLRFCRCRGGEVAA